MFIIHLLEKTAFLLLLAFSRVFCETDILLTHAGQNRECHFTCWSTVCPYNGYPCVWQISELTAHFYPAWWLRCASWHRHVGLVWLSILTRLSSPTGHQNSAVWGPRLVWIFVLPIPRKATAKKVTPNLFLQLLERRPISQELKIQVLLPRASWHVHSMECQMHSF